MGRLPYLARILFVATRSLVQSCGGAPCRVRNRRKRARLRVRPGGCGGQKGGDERDSEESDPAKSDGHNGYCAEPASPCSLRRRRQTTNMTPRLGRFPAPPSPESCRARPLIPGATMTRDHTESGSAGTSAPTRVRYGVLAFAASLSMITYLDRVCISSAAVGHHPRPGASERGRPEVGLRRCSPWPTRCSRCPAAGSATSSGRARC